MKVKILTAAVCVATMAGAGVAQAESLLFPYMKHDAANGAFSIATVVNSLGAAVNTHYTWQHVQSTGGCKHEDANGSLTAYDMLTHAVVDPNQGGGLNLPSAWGDTTGAPAYSLRSATTGFMTIGATHAVTGVDSPESSLVGSMWVMDIVNSTMSAQRAVNNPASTAESTWNNILTSHVAYDLSWVRSDTVTTQWHAVVTGTNMANRDWTGAVTLRNATPRAVSLSPVVYNINEQPRSGVQDNPVVCQETFARAQVMTPEQEIHSTNGGWMRVAVQPNLATFATGVLISKLETSTALGGMRAATVAPENAFPNWPY